MKKVKLAEEVKGKCFRRTGGTFTGQSIKYFFRGELVGWTELPNYSDSYIRFLIAESIKVEEFDNFQILDVDGSVRGDVSQIKGLLVSDIDTDFGRACGIEYNRFLKRDRDNDLCKSCGRPILPTNIISHGL